MREQLRKPAREFQLGSRKVVDAGRIAGRFVGGTLHRPDSGADHGQSLAGHEYAKCLQFLAQGSIPPHWHRGGGGLD